MGKILVGHATITEHRALAPTEHLIISESGAGVPLAGCELHYAGQLTGATVRGAHVNGVGVDGVLCHAAAELAVALLLAAAKTIVPADRALRRGDWRARYDGTPTLILAGKTALVLGLGAIGTRVAAACHALEMAEASDVTLDIRTAAIPLLPDALEYAREGFLTGGGMSNREFVTGEISIEGELEKALEMLLYDPQTSGGLLVALPAASADGYVESILAGGSGRAALIGEVGEYSGSRIILRS